MVFCRLLTYDLNFQTRCEVTHDLFHSFPYRFGVHCFPPVFRDENDVVVEAEYRVSTCIEVVPLHFRHQSITHHSTEQIYGDPSISHGHITPLFFFTAFW